MKCAGCLVLARAASVVLRTQERGLSASSSSEICCLPWAMGGVVLWSGEDPPYLWASLASCGKGEVGVSLVLIPCRALESGDGGVEGALKNNAQRSFLIGQGGVYPGYFFLIFYFLLSWVFLKTVFLICNC